MTSQDNDDIARAVEVLRAGGLVAFPTETVYGLGADAENEAAVRRVFAVKGRPADHPLIVHLPPDARLEDWTVAPPAMARALAARFWPGPLTLVMRRSPRLPPVVTGGLDTVGVRSPDHPVARALLRAFGGALAAPSANRFGAVSPTTAEHVRHDLGDAVSVVLDGGACPVGVESTIVDLTGDEPAILRPGGVTAEDLAAALGRPVPVRADGRVRTPGQLPSHYAPRAEVQIVPAGEIAAAARAQLARGRRVGVLAPARLDDGLPAGVTGVVVAEGERALAQQVYAAFRQLDALGCEVIVTALPPEQGLGLAVADRLRRAAARKG